MPVAVKIVFSVAIILAGGALLFVDANANNAGPDWLWRGGRNDRLRNILCQSDGALRKYTKPSVLVVWALGLATLWFVVP